MSAPRPFSSFLLLNVTLNRVAKCCQQRQQQSSRRESKQNVIICVKCEQLWRVLGEKVQNYERTPMEYEPTVQQYVTFISVGG